MPWGLENWSSTIWISGRSDLSRSTPRVVNDDPVKTTFRRFGKRAMVPALAASLEQRQGDGHSAADVAEGMRAFIARDTPDFHGR